MPRTEDEIINLLGKMSHAEKAETRRALRWIKMKAALENGEEPTETYVLATSDGRTMDIMSDRSLGLDVGDKPKHWSQKRAVELAERWNRDAPSGDHVKCIYWREHYRAQLERLKNK